MDSKNHAQFHKYFLILPYKILSIIVNRFVFKTKSAQIFLIKTKIRNVIYIIRLVHL